MEHLPAGHVLVVGSANVDLAVVTTRRPQPGETLIGQSASLTAGGKGTNQAVAAARSGAHVHLISAVGDDVHGELVRGALDRAGLERCDLIVSQRPTGLATVVVTPDGENSIIVVPGANADLTPEAVEPLLEGMAAASIVLLTLEIPPATVAFVVERARRLGVRVLLNASPVMPLDAALLGACDPLVVNESEARQLLGDTAEPGSAAELCADLLDAGARSVVVTLGEDGVAYADAAGHGAVAAPAVDVVDTTGAGDCFAGALAARLVAGESLGDAAAFASAAAGLSVTQRGTQDAYPAVETTRGFLTVSTPD